MLLGNKCDMSAQRVITKERGEAKAREHSITFMETSAKANINIEETFMHLTEVILNKKLREKPEELPQSVDVSQKDFRSKINKCC